MQRPTLAGLGALAGAAMVGGWIVLSGEAEGTSDTASGAAGIVSVSVPAALSANAQIGERAFNSICVACHGPNGSGIDGAGPPLIHKIYEPSHHGDESFQRAVSVGVRAHHWTFGDMPRIEGLSRADVTYIIAYIRELQRFNGIN